MQGAVGRSKYPGLNYLGRQRGHRGLLGMRRIWDLLMLMRFGTISSVMVHDMLSGGGHAQRRETGSRE